MLVHVNNSPSQDSNHPDDLFQSRHVSPGFKPFSYIYIMNLFVLMSFDLYLYLILKEVNSYHSILNLCEVAVLLGLYCVMCWTGTFVIFLLEICYCVVVLWCQSLCLMYYWISKGMKYCHRGLVVCQWLSY